MKAIVKCNGVRQEIEMTEQVQELLEAYKRYLLLIGLIPIPTDDSSVPFIIDETK